MQPLLRLLIWLLALLFAASPVLLTIAKSPSHQSDVFTFSSYVEYPRDVAFIIVAIIAIGLVDALEVLASLFGGKPAQTWVAFLAFVLVLAFIPLLSVFTTWAAPGSHMTDVDIAQMSTLGGAALVCAFGARITAVFGA